MSKTYVSSSEEYNDLVVQNVIDNEVDISTDEEYRDEVTTSRESAIGIDSKSGSNNGQISQIISIECEACTENAVDNNSQSGDFEQNQNGVHEPLQYSLDQSLKNALKSSGIDQTQEVYNVTMEQRLDILRQMDSDFRRLNQNNKDAAQRMEAAKKFQAFKDREFLDKLARQGEVSPVKKTNTGSSQTSMKRAAIEDALNKVISSKLAKSEIMVAELPKEARARAELNKKLGGINRTKLDDATKRKADWKRKVESRKKQIQNNRGLAAEIDVYLNKNNNNIIAAIDELESRAPASFPQDNPIFLELYDKFQKRQERLGQGSQPPEQFKQIAKEAAAKGRDEMRRGSKERLRTKLDDVNNKKHKEFLRNAEWERQIARESVECKVAKMFKEARARAELNKKLDSINRTKLDDATRRKADWKRKVESRKKLDQALDNIFASKRDVIPLRYGEDVYVQSGFTQHMQIQNNRGLAAEIDVYLNENNNNIIAAIDELESRAPASFPQDNPIFLELYDKFQKRQERLGQGSQPPEQFKQIAKEAAAKGRDEMRRRAREQLHAKLDSINRVKFQEFTKREAQRQSSLSLDQGQAESLGAGSNQAAANNIAIEGRPAQKSFEGFVSFYAPPAVLAGSFSGHVNSALASPIQYAAITAPGASDSDPKEVRIWGRPSFEYTGYNIEGVDAKYRNKGLSLGIDAESARVRYGGALGIVGIGGKVQNTSLDGRRYEASGYLARKVKNIELLAAVFVSNQHENSGAFSGKLRHRALGFAPAVTYKKHIRGADISLSAGSKYIDIRHAGAKFTPAPGSEFTTNPYSASYKSAFINASILMPVVCNNIHTRLCAGYELYKTRQGDISYYYSAAPGSTTTIPVRNSRGSVSNIGGALIYKRSFLEAALDYKLYTGSSFESSIFSLKIKTSL